MRILIISLLVCSNIFFAQEMDSIKIQKKMDLILKKFKSEYQNVNNPFYKKLILSLKKDSLIFNDINGEFTNRKFYNLISKLILDEQVDVLKLMAKRTLTKSEFKKFDKIKFEIGKSTNVEMPIVAYEKNIYFDNSSVFDFLIRSLIKNKIKDLNIFENIYYLTALQISNDIVPEFVGDLFEFNNSDQFLATIMGQSYLTFFIVMHEFYHTEYDNIELPILDREINADNFALIQCTKLLNDSSTVNEKDLEMSLRNLFGEDFIKKIKNNKTCNYSKIVGDKVQLNDFPAIFIGVSALNLIMEREYMTFLVTPSNLEINLKRISNQYEKARELAKCNENYDNLFCCMIDLNYNENNKLINQVSNFSAIEKNIKIDKEIFLSKNKNEPSVISFQLGYYYWLTNDKIKAIDYLNSANLFENDTPSKLLCNIILCDIHLNDKEFYNKELARKYFENSNVINNNIRIFRKEIMEKYSNSFN